MKRDITLLLHRSLLKRRSRIQCAQTDSNQAFQHSYGLPSGLQHLANFSVGPRSSMLENRRTNLRESQFRSSSRLSHSPLSIHSAEPDHLDQRMHFCRNSELWSPFHPEEKQIERIKEGGHVWMVGLCAESRDCSGSPELAGSTVHMVDIGHQWRKRSLVENVGIQRGFGPMMRPITK